MQMSSTHPYKYNSVVEDGWAPKGIPWGPARPNRGIYKGKEDEKQTLQDLNWQQYVKRMDATDTRVTKEWLDKQEAMRQSHKDSPTYRIPMYKRSLRQAQQTLSKAAEVSEDPHTLLEVQGLLTHRDQLAKFEDDLRLSMEKLYLMKRADVLNTKVEALLTSRSTPSKPITDKQLNPKKAAPGLGFSRLPTADPFATRSRASTARSIRSARSARK